MRRLDIDHSGRFCIGELMLQGSAQLLGLLLDKAQGREEAMEGKLVKAESEIEELKARRAEDAKANEKVVGIFAAHEQSWIAERKRLGLRIHALANELRAVRAKNEENVVELAKRVEEAESAIRCKDEELADEARRRREAEERLEMEQEASAKETQDRSAELWEHKTALAELVSGKRQLEAETGRALRLAEALKREAEVAREREEEAAAAAERLTDELFRQRKDGEQKDKILSAMLRKAKIDTAEKQVLLKEVDTANAKKQQAEQEAERRRHKKGSRMARAAEAGCSRESAAELQLSSSGCNPNALLLEYFEAESRKDHEFEGDKIIAASDCFDQRQSIGGNGELDDIQQLKEWVHKEAEKYAMILAQRHYADIEAFSEQMRLKDEKLEVLSWQLLSMELESKRLQSHIEGLDGNLSQIQEENFKLEAILIDREKELKSLKEQFSSHLQHCQKSSSHVNLQALWSEVKITKKKPREKEQATKVKSVLDSQKTGRKTDTEDVIEAQKILQLKSCDYKELSYGENTVTHITTPNIFNGESPTNHCEELAIVCISEQSIEEPEILECPSEDLNKEIEEEKEVSIDPGHHVQMQNKFQVNANNAERLISPRQSFVGKDSTMKLDIHALGVSYKIKRLKQQLLVLEKLIGGQELKHSATKVDASHAIKGFLILVSFLNKQVQRYQSLEEKTDDLCRKMHENSRTGSRRDSQGGRTKEQIQVLQGFLEETFQLQRFMVATGQKLMEVQSRIAASFVRSDGLDESAGFNMGQFADVVRTLFREIQRGLEVRISRIIGDLEGTLAFGGILR